MGSQTAPEGASATSPGNEKPSESVRTTGTAVPEEASRTGMLQRTFDILGAFRPNDLSVPPAQLARRAGLSKATGHRIIQEMISLGMLERTESGVRLGIRMFEIGQLVPMQRNLRRAALPFMSDLREATRATVHLAILDGTDVLYVEIMQRADDLPSRVGGRIPAYATGVGKAMLAYSPSYVVDRALAGPLRRLGPNTITRPDLLRKELLTIRRQGVAYDREEAMEGLVCAAAPILSLDGAVLGGLSVSNHVGSISPQRVAPAVRIAALGLGRTLNRSLQNRDETVG